MKIPTKEQRLQFWMKTYARSSFVDTILYCNALIEIPPPHIGSLFSKSLTTALVVTYCGPFKQRDPVRLPKTMVLNKFQGHHKSLETMRDQVVAHRDLKRPQADFGFVSRLIVFRDATGIEYHTFSPFLDNAGAQGTRDLCQALIDLLEPDISDFTNEFNPYLITEPGRYILSMDDAPSEWLMRQK